MKSTGQMVSLDTAVLIVNALIMNIGLVIVFVVEIGNMASNCLTCGGKILDNPAYVGDVVFGSGFFGTRAKNHFYCSLECMATARSKRYDDEDDYGDDEYDM